MKVAILKYNAGNVLSVQNALARLGVESLITDVFSELESADKVIFPGVGEAASAMAYLKTHGLDRCLKGLKQPLLGICLGLQLLCDYSAEGDTQCLGHFPLKVARFTKAPKVPQIGWNSISNLKGPLFKGIAENAYVYFVHSFFAPLGAATVAQCDYHEPFSAALAQGNFWATQFHPEKSGPVGAKILKNFLEL